MAGRCSCKVFQSVAAYELARIIDTVVEFLQLKQLSEGVQPQSRPDVDGARVSGRKEKQQERQGERRVELNERIDEQVSGSGLLASVPIDNAADPDQNQRTQ